MATSEHHPDGPSGSAGDRDAVELLAEQFAARIRSGDTPQIDQYVSEYPHLAEAIQELFPTIEVLERLRKKNQRPAGGRITGGVGQLERLGDFLILREIGRGGMGVVYEAEQQSLGRRVAVKVLPKQFLLDDKSLQRFRREAQTAAQLHHTNIVPVLGVGHDEGYHYYAMQFIHGIGIDEVIAALRGEPMPRVDATPARSFVAELRSLQSDARLPASSTSPRPFATPTAPTATIDSAATPPPPIIAAQQRSIAPPPAPPSSGSGHAGGSSGSVSPRNLGRPTRSSYWGELAHLGWQVASALAYAHEHGTLHRDIKPSNLIVDREGTVWVADFGLAKAVEQEGISRTGDIVGTLRYMAPEQLRGEADPRSDLYSLGLTLYELITLEPAFDEAALKQRMAGGGTTGPVAPRKRNPAVPRDLETIVLKACAAEPSQRYPSAAELAADLRRFIEDRPIVARRASAWEKTWRWARRNPAVASLSAATLLLLAAVALVASVGYVRTQRALARESEQRQKSDATLNYSLQALDHIYQQFAPDQSLSPSVVSVDGGDGGGAMTQPALSRETATLLKDLLSFYDELANLDSDRVDLRKQRAKANRRVGDLFLRLGQTQQATEAYASAIARYRELAAAAGQPDAYDMELARIYDSLGNLHRQLGERAEADKSYHQALDVLQQYDTPKAPAAKRYELARVYYDLGKQWDPRLTTEAVPQAHGGPGRPLGSGPSRSGPRGSSGPPGNGPREMGGPPGSEPRDHRPPPGERPEGPGGLPPHIGPGSRPPRFGEPPPMLEKEAGGGGKEAGGRGQEAGDGDAKPPEKKEAAPPTTDGAEVIVSPDEMAEAQPGGRGFGPPPPHRPGFGPPPPPFGRPPRGDESTPPVGPGGAGAMPALPGLGGGPPPLRHEDRIDADALNKAIALLVELRQEAPNVPAYARLLALCYRELSPGFQSPGLEKAIDILTQLVKEHPRVPDYRWDLCESLANFGPPDVTAANFAQAEQRLREAREYAEQLDPHVPAYVFTQVHIDLKLGTLLRMKAEDRPGPEATAWQQESLDVLQQAMQLQNNLVNEFPDVDAYRLWVARISRPLANMLLALARGDRRQQTEAVEVLERGIESLKPLASRPDSLSTVHQELWASYRLLAHARDLAGDAPGAQQARDLAEAERQAAGGQP